MCLCYSTQGLVQLIDETLRPPKSEPVAAQPGLHRQHPVRMGEGLQQGLHELPNPKCCINNLIAESLGSQGKREGIGAGIGGLGTGLRTVYISQPVEEYFHISTTGMALGC